MGPNPDRVRKLPPDQQIAEFFKAFVAALRKRPAIQDILAWELLECNELTMQLEDVRIRTIPEYFEYLEEIPDGDNLTAVVALMGSAVHHIIVRNRINRSYAGINLESEAGRERINKGINGHYPGGRYVVLYEGEADFFTRTTIWDSDGTPMPNDAVLNATLSVPGRLVMDVTPSNSGFVLSYKNISSTDPVKNLQIVHEDYEGSFATEIFHPQFIQSIQPFNTLRFMDLMRTNGSDQSRWEDRPRPTDALQGNAKGMALEYLIALANKAEANPLFNIPHLATDDYVEHFAAMVRDQLDGERQVFVEYSNEVWNGSFEQYHWAESQGEASELGTGRDAADRYYCRRSGDRRRGTNGIQPGQR